MKHRILLVEDDPSNAQLFRIICEVAGYEVLEAANGLGALEILGTEAVDLVLMDLKMPELDGLSATRAIKAHHSLANLPVVIITAWAGPESREALRAAGATEILLKPFTRQELVACVSAVLQEAKR